MKDYVMKAVYLDKGQPTLVHVCADLDRDPDMVPSGPGRVTFTPLVRTVGYDGEHGKRIVSLHPFEAVVGDDGHLYTPDEYGQPGIRGIVLPSNNSDVVDEHDWTWRVTFDIPDTTIRTTHIPTPHDHSVDIKDYLDSDANHGVRVVVDRVAARETLTARDQTLAARDLVLPARDETLDARDETLAHGITVDTSVGTRVFVGDTMIHGDTGWRDISNDDGLLLNGWGIRSAGRFRLRRENSVVYIQATYLYGSDANSEDLFKFPSGFSPQDRNNFMHIPARDINANPINATVTWDGTIRIKESDKEGPSIMGAFMTPQGWPTSLPGTPA